MTRLSLFGAKALGLGKPLMALVTFLSVSCGYCAFRVVPPEEALASTIAALRQMLVQNLST